MSVLASPRPSHSRAPQRRLTRHFPASSLPEAQVDKHPDIALLTERYNGMRQDPSATSREVSAAYGVVYNGRADIYGEEAMRLSLRKQQGHADATLRSLAHAVE